MKQLNITSMDVDNIIRFMELQKFDTFSTSVGATMKKTHTVIEPWPTALKLLPTQEGAQEEFGLLLSSSCSGLERYIEWRRVE
jgi:hypothetical protein